MSAAERDRIISADPVSLSGPGVFPWDVAGVYEGSVKFLGTRKAFASGASRLVFDLTMECELLENLETSNTQMMR